MKKLVLVISMLAVVLGTVSSQAAEQTMYDRNAFISGADVVDVSFDCHADGSGSFSFITNATMVENGNPVTITGSVVIAINKQNLQYVKSFAGQWVETTPSGNITGTYSVKNFMEFIGAQGCFDYTTYPPPQSGYHILATMIAPFKGRDTQGRRISGEINISVSDCNYVDSSGGTCNGDGIAALT